MPLLYARCVAPPITTAMLDAWGPLFAQLEPRMAELVQWALQIVKAHKAGGKLKLPSRPWCQSMEAAFEELAEPHRTPAFHCLWYVNELALGRSPE
jgi:hypothetical protein